MFSPQSLEESSSFQKSFNIGIETPLKKTVLREHSLFLNCVHIQMARGICCSMLENMLARKDASQDHFLLLWDSKREGCPRALSKPTFWALELHDPQGEEDGLFRNPMEVWTLRSFVRQKKKDVWAKVAKHTNHLWHGFLAFCFSFWVSSGEQKFHPRIRVSSGYCE